MSFVDHVSFEDLWEFFSLCELLKFKVSVAVHALPITTGTSSSTVLGMPQVTPKQAWDRMQDSVHMPRLRTMFATKYVVNFQLVWT